jgi:hypothetical protein
MLTHRFSQNRAMKLFGVMVMKGVLLKIAGKVGYKTTLHGWNLNSENAIGLSKIVVPYISIVIGTLDTI